MKNLLFISMLSCILLNSCVKKECQIAGGFYEFEIPVSLTPAKDTFNIGDTITITSTFSDEVYERKTDAWYRLEEFKFFPSTEINKIDSIPSIPSVSNYFDLLIDSNQMYGLQEFSDGSQVIVGEYLYASEIYSLHLKLIVKQSGLFYMEQGVSPDITSNQDFEGKCSNIENDGAVNLNEGADNNIDMLRDSPDPHYNEWIVLKPEDRFYKFGGYCFYVRE